MSCARLEPVLSNTKPAATILKRQRRLWIAVIGLPENAASDAVVAGLHCALLTSAGSNEFDLDHDGRAAGDSGKGGSTYDLNRGPNAERRK